MTGGNLFAGLPERTEEEQVQALSAAGDVAIERIVSTGQASPPGFWYDQERTEWVALLRGGAGIRFADEAETRTLRPGDWVEIDAHRRHRIDWTDPNRPTAWLAIFYRDERQ